MSVAQLQEINTDRYDIDELVSLSAEAASLRAEYEKLSSLGLSVPEWLSDAQLVLSREIKSRQADAIEKRIRTAKNRLSALKTAAERRQEVAEELGKLEDQKSKLV